MNDETNHIARDQVMEFIKILEKDHGITLDEIKSAIKHYRRMSQVLLIFGNALIAGLAMAFLYLLWAGVIHYVAFYLKP